MAISNLSTGLRPGVCTSTTRPGTPFEGQMIYETDTNRVLVYEGAAWVMIADTDTPPGLVLIKAETFTSATTWDVKSCFTTTHDFYRINIQFSSGTGTVLMQLIDGTTPTVRSGSHYYSAGFSVAFNGGLATANDNAATSYGVTSGSSINAHAAFTIDLRYNPNGQTMWTSAGHLTAAGVTVHKSGGYHTTEAHDGFRLSSSANMAGTVRVYGYRNTI